MDYTSKEALAGLICRARGQLDSSDKFQLDDRSPRHTDWLCMRREDVAALIYVADERMALLDVMNGVARERDEYKKALKDALASSAVARLVEIARTFLDNYRARRRADKEAGRAVQGAFIYDDLAEALAAVEKEIGT